jgi:hypothetical protein
MQKNWKWIVVLALSAYVILLWVWTLFGFSTEIEICEPANGVNNCSSHYVLVSIIRWVLFQLDRHGILISAIATVFIARFTWTLWRSTEKMWEASQRQIGISDAANKLNREHFILGERPWIKPEIIIAGPLRFERGNASIKLEVKTTNVGKTPAFKVHPFIWSHECGFDLGVIDLHRRYSKTIRNLPMSEADSGRVLFPDETETFCDESTVARWGPQQINLAKAASPDEVNFFAPGIIVCIDYASVLRDVHYQTTRIYILMQTIPLSNVVPVLPKVMGYLSLNRPEIPANELVLLPHPQGSITT